MIYRQVELYNVQHIIETPRGIRMSRVPETVRTAINKNAGEIRAFNTCGCEIRFNLIGEEARVVLRKAEGPKASEAGLAEVYFGSFQAAYPATPIAVGSEDTTIVIRNPDNLDQLTELTKQQRLPFDPALVRIILPYDWIYELVSIEGEVSPPRPEQSPGLRYLAYGSSITHGGDAVRPTGSYAMRTAQRLGADLISMGFAGSAQMDGALAEYIAGREDWDFATVEMGINVIQSWEPELFERKVTHFLSVISERCPDKWVFCTDLFTCIHDLENNPHVSSYRDIVKDAVEKLERTRLVYIPGTELLSSWNGLTADLVHPSASGQEEIAERLASRIRMRLHP